MPSHPMGGVSVALPTVQPMSINPWHVLRALEHIELRWHDGGVMGRTSHTGGFISLRRGMSWAERRCTVLHECLHVERGPMPRGLKAKDEESVRRETALRMIPEIGAVGDALAWSLSMEEAADELGVDIYVLRYRLKHMSPLERAWLHARLEADDAIESDPAMADPEVGNWHG